MISEPKLPQLGASLTKISGPLTDKIVAALAPPNKGSKIYWDGGTGFGVRVTAAGARAFVLRYRNATGTDRTLTIGAPSGGPTGWNVTRARRYGDDLRQQIDTGVDPLADRQTTRDAPTITDLADRFEREHLARRRPTTARDYKSMLRLHIRPVLGREKVAVVRSEDIEALHRKISATAPYSANRTVAVLSKMFALAIKWGMRTDNPTKGIERAPEHRRERFLSPAEIARLSEVLAVHPEQVSANAVRLLMLTGARRGETLSAEWNQFDLGSGVWVKPSAATKSGKLHRIPLSAPARELLVGMKAEADTENERRARAGFSPIPFVFPGAEGKPLGDVKHFWAAVCRKAGLSIQVEKTDDNRRPILDAHGAPVLVWQPTVRLHDLRHTHASILASLGLSLPIIGALLGHTQAATTHRYAHLMDDPLRAATERVGVIVMGSGKAGGEVVPMTRKAGA